MTPDRLGPYRIERLLGQGGMGSVYLGTHGETGQQAAVKTLSSTLSQDEDFRERFAGEIESLKKLRHPNIVQLFGWGEQDDVLFYAMEAVDGQSLQERLAQGDRIEWREAIQIGISVCKALKHAHDSGIIHRDLKPANLLLDADGNVKLTDFGIAKLFGYTQLTVEGGVVGTADYMAPEQALGQPINHRCDLYSLGTVLYTLLAGRPPFLAKSMPEVVHKVCYESPQPIRRFNASVPPQLEELITQLLEKDAAKRPPTARAVTTRLEAMQHGLTDARQRDLPGEDTHSTDFDYSEPGATSTPSEPRVHSATTRFAVGEEKSESTPEKTTVGETVQTGAPPPKAPATKAPKRDATVEIDSNAGDASASRAESKLGSPPDSEKPSKSRFTTLEEAAAESAQQGLSEKQKQRWAMGGMALILLVIVGFITWQVLVPPSADNLYASIQASLEENPESTAAIESEINRFLKIYPNDSRSAELRAELDAIQLERSRRNFERRGRRAGTEEALSPLEGAYYEAVELGRTRPDLAIVRLQAIVDVYGAADETSPQTKDMVELARDQLEQFRQNLATEGKKHATELQARLQAAAELEATDPAKAKSIYAGLVLLYEGQSWAEELVKQARDRLAKLNAAE